MTCLAQKGNPFSRNGPKLHRKLFVQVDNFINELVLRNIKRNLKDKTEKNLFRMKLSRGLLR